MQSFKIIFFVQLLDFLGGAREKIVYLCEEVAESHYLLLIWNIT